jgi:hypothetical protein
MANRFWLLPLCILLVEPTPNRPPFEMRVVDERTGLPVPDIRITTDNGIVCHTLGTGACFWWRSSLMNRDVRFQIQDETNQFDSIGATLRVTHAGQAEIKIRRRT